jgi:hypothetical protein
VCSSIHCKVPWEAAVHPNTRKLGGVPTSGPLVYPQQINLQLTPVVKQGPVPVPGSSQLSSALGPAAGKETPTVLLVWATITRWPQAREGQGHMAPEEWLPLTL